MFHLQSLELLHWDYCQRVTLPLDGAIITIAGPNGSGKTTLLDAMRTLMHGRTTLIIGHRLSTVKYADQIFVLRGGEVVERGTHQELMDAHGVYQELYAIQFERRKAEA